MVEQKNGRTLTNPNCSVGFNTLNAEMYIGPNQQRHGESLYIKFNFKFT